MATLFANPRYTPVDAQGDPYPGATLTFYAAGTTTAQAVYTTSALTTPHPSPVTANSAGQFPAIYYDDALQYRAILRDATGVLLWDIDTINSSLTPEEVGQALYPRTQGEISANITPSAYRHPPGDFRRYGAVGSGTADDSTAVQRAFNSGAVVTGQRGATYNCAAVTISVPAGVQASLYGVKLKSAVIGTTFLDITGDNVTILGAEIEGRGNSSATLDETAIRINGASAAAYRNSVTIRDCYIHDWGFYGINSEWAENVRILGCRFKNIGYSCAQGLSALSWVIDGNVIDTVSPGSSGNAYGFYFGRRGTGGSLATYPRSKNCTASNNVIRNIPLWEGLDTHGGEKIAFVGNVIENCRYGINVSPASTDNYAPLEITIAGNVIDSGTLSSDPGRAIGSGGYDSSNKARNITVTGNVVKGYGLNVNTEGALMFQYTDGLNCTGNVIHDSRAAGIMLQLDNDDFLLSGNTIRGVRNGVANAAGISVRGTTQTGHIVGNYIDATAEIGIFIGATNTGVSFAENRIITSGSQYTDAINGGAGILLEGSETTDVASIADGDQAQFTVTVTGAELGDHVVGVGCSISTAALSLTGTVTATNTATLVLQNNTGGPVDLGSATYYVLVRKR